VSSFSSIRARLLSSGLGRRADRGRGGARARAQTSKMMEKLWGDNFFDPATKKWTKKSTGAASCKRGFVQFVYEPIKTIIEAAMADNKKKLFEMCGRRAPRCRAARLSEWGCYGRSPVLLHCSAVHLCTVAGLCLDRCPKAAPYQRVRGGQRVLALQPAEVLSTRKRPCPSTPRSASAGPRCVALTRPSVRHGAAARAAPMQVCRAPRCDKLGISGKLKAEDKELVGKPLMKRCMQAWLPAHEVPPPPPLRTARPARALAAHESTPRGRGEAWACQAARGATEQRSSV